MNKKLFEVVRTQIIDVLYCIYGDVSKYRIDREVLRVGLIKDGFILFESNNKNNSLKIVLSFKGNNLILKRVLCDDSIILLDETYSSFNKINFKKTLEDELLRLKKLHPSEKFVGTYLRNLNWIDKYKEFEETDIFIKNIREFCKKEYDNSYLTVLDELLNIDYLFDVFNAVDEDYLLNKNKIYLAYTNTEDEQYDINFYLDMEKLIEVQTVNGKIIFESNPFSNSNETLNYLDFVSTFKPYLMSFDDMISVDDCDLAKIGLKTDDDSFNFVEI